MKFYGSGEDLAKDMGVPLSVIEQAHEDHFQAARKTETDPDGGPYPAYPSGKCWDEARARDGISQNACLLCFNISVVFD